MAKLLQAIPWTDFPLNQLTWRAMAHSNFEPTPSILDHLRRLYYGVGDTRVIECTNQKLRARFKDSTTDSVGTMEMYRTMTLGDVLKERGLPSIDVADEDLAQSSPPQGGWRRAFHPETHAGPEGGKGILLKGKDRKWQNSTPGSLSRGSVSAWAALRKLSTCGKLKSSLTAWKSVLLQPRTVVRCQGQVYLIVAAGPWAAGGWLLTASDTGGFLVYPRLDIAWLVVLDETQWEVLPFEPAAAASPSLEAGLLELRPTAPWVPALAWALAECALTDWMVTAWAKEHQLPPDAFQSTVAMSRAMVALIMGDHPDAAQYLDMLRNENVRQRTKVAKDTEDRSRAALQSVDAGNIEVMFKAMERIYKPTMFPDGDVDAQVARPLQASGSSHATPPPGGRAPPKETSAEPPTG